ncbi:MAG TPA: hypothetical protein VME66_08375, partial [Candidatus Acidoferrales bacterium]|nr:hypothetical protein [Candidatus Acidoferrales bacterium]
MDFAGYDALNQMQQLLSELDAAERELIEQRGAVDEAAQRIAAAEQEVSAARENAKRAYTEIRRRENELALLHASFAPTLERREQLVQSLEQRRAALEQAHHKRLEGEEQAACIFYALQDLERGAQESEARRGALRLTIEQLQAELAELEARITSERAGREHLAREH